MPSDDDLKSYATSTTDFYDLLGVTSESSQKDVERGWRRTALSCHPDKVKGEIAKEKFHLAQIGLDILSSPTLKSLYDNTRNARVLKKQQNAQYEGRRRQMKDDLEARERGVKRAKTEEEDSEEKLERELRRLAEDGKRRRKEREDALKHDLQREAGQGDTESRGSPISGGRNEPNGSVNQESGVPELNRTIRVRWPKDGPGESIDLQLIVKLFSRFGKVESTILLNPKMLRTGEKKKKQLTQVCMITFTSIIGAYDAIEKTRKEQDRPEWKVFNSIKMASDKQPDIVSGYQSNGSDAGSAPSTPARNGSSAAFLSMGDKPSMPAASINGEGLRKMPSFSSFSSTPKGSPFGRSLGVNSPSLEEMTMIRLKNAEKKRLADEIQRQDDEAYAAAVKGEGGQL